MQNIEDDAKNLYLKPFPTISIVLCTLGNYGYRDVRLGPSTQARYSNQFCMPICQNQSKLYSGLGDKIWFA